MSEGLPKLAVGLNLAVRNRKTHAVLGVDEQEALEYLGADSALARLLNKCDVVPSGKTQPPTEES